MLNEEQDNTRFRDLGYTNKLLGEIQRQQNTKLVRYMRQFDKRIRRIEKQLGITASPDELEDLVKETDRGFEPANNRRTD